MHCELLSAIEMTKYRHRGSKITFLTIALIFFICAHNVVAEPLIGDQLGGIWINKTYLSFLKESLSFKAASQSTHFPALIYNPKIKELMLVLNFHEGVTVKVKQIDSISGAFIFESPNPTLKSLVFKDSLCIAELRHDSTILKQEYVRISEQYNDYYRQIGKFLAREILVGQYRDKNNVIVFEDEISIWNGKKFKYKPVLSYVEFIPIDAFVLLDSNGHYSKIFGFATNGAMFQIYELDENAKVIKALLYDLTKK